MVPPSLPHLSLGPVQSLYLQCPTQILPSLPHLPQILSPHAKMTQLSLSSSSLVCVSIDLHLHDQWKYSWSTYTLLRGRKAAGSHLESLSHPLAKCLTVCEVLVGYPGVLIFTPAWAHSQPPLQVSSKEAMTPGHLLAPENFTDEISSFQRLPWQSRPCDESHQLTRSSGRLTARHLVS